MCPQKAPTTTRYFLRNWEAISTERGLNLERYLRWLGAKCNRSYGNLCGCWECDDVLFRIEYHPPETCRHSWQFPGYRVVICN